MSSDAIVFVGLMPHAGLDPALYGVLVGNAAGRKGLLLPGIKSIDTVADQLRLAKQKGGIKAGETVKIQRFTTQTYQEPFVLGRED